LLEYTRFMANVTFLLQHDHVDIDMEVPYNNKTLLYEVCYTTNLSDWDQYDAIMYLLKQGVDPNKASVLRWVIHRF
jgi:GH18 family chitinase